MKNNSPVSNQNKVTPSIPLIRGRFNSPLSRGARRVLNILLYANKIFIWVCFSFLISIEPQILEASPKEIPATKVETSKKLYTVIEFESTFMNKRKEDVVKALGEPDSKSQVQEKEVWRYNQIVKDVGKVWDQNIMFDFGRVNYIWSDNGK